MLNFLPRQDETIQNPEANSLTLFLESGSGKLMTKDDAGLVLQLATTEDVEAVRPFGVYKALLTQTSTNAPVATIVEDTIEGTIVWAYSSEGVYTATLTGAFTANKTLIILNSNTVAAVRTSADVITLTGASNGLLTGTTFIVEVYP